MNVYELVQQASDEDGNMEVYASTHEGPELEVLALEVMEEDNGDKYLSINLGRER